MTAKELSETMTGREANNVLAYWRDKTPDKLMEAQDLVSMGDTKAFAVACVMLREVEIPNCPRCGNNRQVWRNQGTGRLTCHRVFCNTEI